MQPRRLRRDPWPIDKRRIFKMFKFLRVHFLYNCRKIPVTVFIALSATLILLYRLLSGRFATASLFSDSKAFFVPHLSREEVLSRELSLSQQHICSRRKVDNNVEELRFCGSFETRGTNKIVGLVEVRNVEASIIPFLSALGEVVDSIVIIDDRSSDASRLRILQHVSIYTNTKPVVEVLLNKTGEWTREELFDRELLLTTARRVGGTHFVLLDYDEYLSTNCVENGLLRRTILQLAPGESLNLPWIELWKSHRLQRVLPDDPHMNFLTRRQTVIFADDGTSHYTSETANARLLGSHSRNSTIHVLRCPRTICPRPPKYKGPDSELDEDSRVKRLPQCAIVEMRFLNLNNVLLKSAWYEALGRVTKADEGLTSGKMINLVFPGRNASSQQGYRLESVDPKLLGEHALAGAQSLEAVELWRAEELLQWMDLRGKSAFADLHSLNLIDIDELRNVRQQSRSDPGNASCHVPRRKDGTLVVIHDNPVKDVVGKLLVEVGFSEVKLDRIWNCYPEDEELETFRNEGLAFEHWKTVVMSKIHRTLQQSNASQAFLILSRHSDPVCLTFLDTLRREMAHVNVVMLSTTPSPSVDDDMISMKVKTFAEEKGSHIQLIKFPVENFGSYAAVHWLARRLTMATGKSNQTEANDRSLLNFVEQLHVESRKQNQNVTSPKYAPVGKLIFSLNFGRSGSKYLADLIRTTRGLVVSQHEPVCPYRACSGGGALRTQDRSLVESYEDRKLVKLPMIRQAITNLSQTYEADMFDSRTIDCDALNSLSAIDQHLGHVGGEGSRQTPILEINSRSGCAVHILPEAVYAETNPNFKSWIYDISLDFFPKAGYDVHVVVLRKYVAALLKSLYETGYFTVKDGYNWMETLSSINSKVTIPSLQDDNQLDAFGRILSYLVNSEALFRHVLKQYKSDGSALRFHEMRSERLYSLEGTMEVLELLGLEPTETTAALAGSVRDKYIEGTSKKRESVSLVECERHVSQFLDRITADEAKVLQDLVKRLDKLDGYEYPP